MTSIVPHIPSTSSPLSDYRNMADFDWKILKLFLEGEERLKIKYSIWKQLEKDLLFKSPPITLPADDQKKLAAMRMKKISELGFMTDETKNASYLKRTNFLMTQNEALHALCPSLSVKMALGIGLFCNALLALGSERHRKFHNAAMNGDIVTAIAITEVSHGSNTKRIRTTATYDKKTKEFIINTPDFEAAKCWVGNLGKTASLVLLYAILITSDGESQGLHGFLVPVRDSRTLKPFKGVTIGDIGEKIGLNGIDNGFILFDNFRIPKENLLNRTGDVNNDGEYESVFTEPSKILGAALESLSMGRVGIMFESGNTISHAVTIAVRYSAIRKQFGPDRNGPEVSIIEYPLHQMRIFPYLATACVLKITVQSLSEIYMKTVDKSQADSNGFEILSQSVAELHALISASKAMFTWSTLSALQEARECCGGHGYLKAANIGELRNNHEPTVTYEGDNNVLGQQASNWLLKQWNEGVESPIGSVKFLTRKNEILRNSLEISDVETFDFVLKCYELLLCHFLSATSKKIQNWKAEGADNFKAKNNSQVFGAKTLTLAFAEYYALCTFKRKIESPSTPESLKKVLMEIFLIYGFYNLEKHLASFYVGGFAEGPKLADTFRLKLVELCGRMKNSCVAVADALSPPDFVLNSIIGKSDGMLYKNLEKEFYGNHGAMEVPKWAEEVTSKKNLQSKL